MSEEKIKLNGVVLAIDAGGTYLKSALVVSGGAILADSFYQVKSASEAPATEIVAAYAETIRHALNCAAQAGTVLTGIGVAVPGPFDYARGVSLMKHKFVGIYGVDLIALLKRELPELYGMPFRFRHDANAFLAGELWRGAARGCAGAGGITLGTGLGVACCLDGEFINNELGSPAPEVSLWDTPYRDGIAEDYVSTRALVAAYRRVNPDYDLTAGAKGIEDAAKNGDSAAAAVYEDFGADLGRILMPWCERLTPDIIVFGGQVSKGFALFAPKLRKNLRPQGKCPELAVGKLGPDAALYGAAALFFDDSFHTAL
jgi:glucokinase